MIYYLYIKTHNQTGLKYLGRTSSNPYSYYGSGKYWKNHLKKYGKDISTELIAAFDNKEDLKEAGLFWSKKHNIVESEKWANLVIENGEGWEKGHQSWAKGKQFSKEHKINLSIAKKGKRSNRKEYKHSEESRLKISLSHKGKLHPIQTEKMKLINIGKHRSAETKRKIGASNKIALKGKIPWNKGTKGLMTAWNKGVPHSEEIKRKISNTKLGISI